MSHVSRRIEPNLLRAAQACVLAIAAIVIIAVFPAPRAQTATPWPGGRWEPGPAPYGSTLISNVRVPMDDGVVLSATLTYPTDPTSGQRAAGTFPVILMQNPYSDEPNLNLVRHGYIFAAVRPRGSGPSGGEMEFLSARDTTDGVSLVQWAAYRLDGSNGVVGGYGCSYTGFTQLATAAAVGPGSPLKAIIPACSGGDWIRESHLVAGIPNQSLHVLGNLGARVGNTPSAVRFFTGWMANILDGGEFAYDGPFWRERNTINVADKIVENGIPALLWTGWSDVEVKALELYAGFQNAFANRPVREPMLPNQPATGRYQIIVGPWGHGQGLDDTLMLEWYDTWLKGVPTGIARTQTPMHLYEQGSNRWVNASRYPLVSSYTPYFFERNGQLTATRPTAAGADRIMWGQPSAAGTMLAYTTPPLAGGATVAGPIAASVYAKSTNQNLELIATLMDVAPDGSATRITHGTILGSQSAPREGWSWHDDDGRIIRPFAQQQRDEYLSPGRQYRFDIALFPRIWAVAPGHALRLVLTTQTPDNVCAPAKPVLQSDPCFLTKPQQRTLPGGVYDIQRGGADAPSSLHLPLLPYQALATATSGTTPTSGGQVQPLYWGPESPAR